MNGIEKQARDEFREGVSAGAAARELIRSLGCSGTAPTLKRMLEETLAKANRQNLHPSCILREFEDAAPEAATDARRKSFASINNRAA
jgi:hypothetical protein